MQNGKTIWKTVNRDNPLFLNIKFLTCKQFYTVHPQIFQNQDKEKEQGTFDLKQIMWGFIYLSIFWSATKWEKAVSVISMYP